MTKVLILATIVMGSSAVVRADIEKSYTQTVKVDKEKDKDKDKQDRAVVTVPDGGSTALLLILAAGSLGVLANRLRAR